MLRLIYLSAILLLLLDICAANTEIISLSATEDYGLDLPFTETWPTLRPGSSTLRLNTTSAKLKTVLMHDICPELDKWRYEHPHQCSHELWVVLDLNDEEWKRFDKFTLRISWAAFHPTDFFIKVYDPAALAAFSQRSADSAKTRQKYARIQLVHAGVLTPPANDTLDAVVRHEVPFVLMLEPLYLGVIPESVIPVIGAILVAIVLGLPLSKGIYGYMLSMAEPVKLEPKTD